MKERFVTLACALGALGLFIVLFVQPGRGLDRPTNIGRPTTAEARGNGYFAAHAWLAASRLRTVSLRERFDALQRADFAPAGNVLIVTLPGTETFRVAETRPLREWIRAGNTLLLIAALADAPDWATAAVGVSVGDLKILSGMDFDPAVQIQEREHSPPVLLPSRAHGYFAGVRRAAAAAPRAAAEWSTRLPRDSFMLALAHEADTGKALLWTRLSGSGRIVVLGLGSLFTDRGLGLADNAQLLANIIGANLGRRGAVIFDDFHQGLSAAYDPEKFYSDPRLYFTSLILLALWFVWVLGATRLRVPIARIAAPREADLVRADGAFLARVLPRDAAARRLFEHFLRRVTLRMPAAARRDPWEYLQASSHAGAPEVEQLRRWHAQARAGARVPLVRLYNLIQRVDGQIA